MRASLERTYQLHRDIQRALLDERASCCTSRSSRSPKLHPSSFEALCAGTIRCAGSCSPGEFEEVFDDPNLAAEVGRWVIDHALRQVAAWERNGLDFGRVSVNVTSADFAWGRLRSWAPVKLQQTGVAPIRLCIAVTERVFLGRGAGSVAVALEKLHNLGVESRSTISAPALDRSRT